MWFDQNAFYFPAAIDQYFPDHHATKISYHSVSDHNARKISHRIVAKISDHHAAMINAAIVSDYNGIYVSDNNTVKNVSTQHRFPIKMQ